MLISTGTLALSFVVMAAAISYSDSVDRSAERIQKELNERACADSIGLIKIKGSFAPGKISLPEFGCEGSL